MLARRRVADRQLPTRKNNMMYLYVDDKNENHYYCGRL
ncbi:hypothetical protein LT85_2003 [Collimonas arenae]|uniref:Uncharacterized protein n=1 Tax=Collimonas arenae TaxID=279058 RepID=A0A0A1F9G1_9BURK|nr:hypothetical protein LT85_2003 [Collimonas arenae]